VRADDPLEPARPERGAFLRVRCAWENTPQGLLKAPLAELVRLSVDGRSVAPAIHAPAPRPNGLRTDHYHFLPLEGFSAGRHTATAVVRVLATGAEVARTVDFTV
jgi:hypothetical protein